MYIKDFVQTQLRHIRKFYPNKKVFAIGSKVEFQAAGNWTDSIMKRGIFRLQQIILPIELTSLLVHDLDL